MPVVLIFKTPEDTIEMPILSKITVGRSGSCDLTIPDKQVSGKHGTFELNAQGQILYKDLESSNGSYLNNNQIQNTIIKINDTLKIGNTVVSIDEKKLSSKERISIGVSDLKGKTGLTMNNSNKTSSEVENVVIAERKISPQEKEPKSVVLNKKLKNPNQEASEEWARNKNEKLIEQEASTGHTKMLKLDIGKLGKKKK